MHFALILLGNLFFLEGNKTGINWGKFVKICQILQLVQARGHFVEEMSI